MEIENEQKQLPAFMEGLAESEITVLDVRPILAAGTDPLQHIMEKIKSLQAGTVLKIINTFEPTPLIRLLGNKGYESAVIKEADNLIETYFFKKANATDTISPLEKKQDDWDIIKNRFDLKTETVDVRAMEMPQPMITILAALDNLPMGNALLVFHKRIPVFLLPELVERNFEYRIKEISDTEVQLVIFHK